ncbi:MAG: hypothetical protein OXN21_15540, partial [Chloroflexota bacterium]|nr:hypothetical protein [Chloroflexota bacterium]
PNMLEFLSTSWGDLASMVGIVVSLVGLGWAIMEAKGARSASEAAKTAATETRDQIARHLQAVDLQRAIGLIERIKTLHDNSRWEASREHYQNLRAMLSDVIARSPESQSDARASLATARTIVREIENLVRRRSGQGITERDRSRMNQSLNDIQSELEELASNMGFGDSLGGTR